MELRIPFDNSYAALPDRFFARIAPTAVDRPELIALNVDLARELGLDSEALAGPEGIAVLSGQAVATGSDPLAMAYAGHQFGQFVPQLGDGRAILLGEVVDRAGKRRDIQLKGSGPTPFSRRGDGRAALGPVLREFLVSEAMAGARHSDDARAGGGHHRRTGLEGDRAARRRPHPRGGEPHPGRNVPVFRRPRRYRGAARCWRTTSSAAFIPTPLAASNPYSALLEAVVLGQASLIARWMLVGFIHGVMNTDNMSVACETIDYGPCAFMDAYDPAKVFSSIDQMGRYAYGNQPRIAQWNLARLAETLLPLLADDEDAAVAEAERVLNLFAPRFSSELQAGFRRKIGLLEARDGDQALIQGLLDAMSAGGADFTLTFRSLAEATVDGLARLSGRTRAVFRSVRL